MRCKVCGKESGRYTLCYSCNLKRKNGEIIKCPVCNGWHYKDKPCPSSDTSAQSKSGNESDFLYEAKESLITNAEKSFYAAIKNAVPPGYLVFPQINLATFIKRTDDFAFHNELFRNVDFLITDDKYRPIIVVEIKDQTHLTSDRKERDKKVNNICEEAGIPMISFWSAYGVNEPYIRRKIEETLNKMPFQRVHHFTQASQPNVSTVVSNSSAARQTYTYKKNGCYIATCVYGSYDCPLVWTLRRFRDLILSRHWYGRIFIRFYYSVSPTLVNLFGNARWFHRLFKSALNRMVYSLQKRGVDGTPYHDKAEIE